MALYPVAIRRFSQRRLCYKGWMLLQRSGRAKKVVAYAFFIMFCSIFPLQPRRGYGTSDKWITDHFNRIGWESTSDLDGTFG